MIDARIPPEWIIPDWPAPPNVRALMTTRAGGVSEGSYATMNVGKSSGDAMANVLANRARLVDLIGRPIRWLHQVHGNTVIEADCLDADERADAQFTCGSGIACAAMVADCMPVLFARKDGSAVASAHAGWRGLSGGVLENTLSALAKAQLDANPAAQKVGFSSEKISDESASNCAAGTNEMRTENAARAVIAWLGPCIGPTAFEVGDDVLAAFAQHDPRAVEAFVTRVDRPGKYFCDLPALARMRLIDAGMNAHDIYGDDGCTLSESERFFSYRREQKSGRMVALIWRIDNT